MRKNKHLKNSLLNHLLNPGAPHWSSLCSPPLSLKYTGTCVFSQGFPCNQWDGEGESGMQLLHLGWTRTPPPLSLQFTWNLFWWMVGIQFHFFRVHNQLFCYHFANSPFPPSQWSIKTALTLVRSSEMSWVFVSIFIEMYLISNVGLVSHAQQSHMQYI